MTQATRLMLRPMVEAEARILAQIEAGTTIGWDLVLRESGAVAGTAGLHHIDRERGSAQVAYEIVREHSGKGLISEALRCVIDHAFGDLGLRTLEAHVDPDNERSIRVAEKLGFSRSAEIPGTVIYVLTSSGRERI